MELGLEALGTGVWRAPFLGYKGRQGLHTVAQWTRTPAERVTATPPLEYFALRLNA